MENNRIIKTKLFSGGKFELKFTTQEDYKKYTNKRLTLIILILTAFLSFLLTIIFLISSFENVYLILVSLALGILSLISVKLYSILEIRFLKYKYRLVIEQIKTNEWKLENSNDETGHIKYSIDGDGHSIYVFKKRTLKK